MRKSFSLRKSGFVLIILGSISLAFLAAAPSEYPAGEDQRLLTKETPAAVSVQQKYTPQLMDIPGVFGTAVGLTEDGKPCILVLTKTDISSAGSLPDQIENIPVRMMVTGELSSQKISHLKILMPSLFTGC